MKLTIQRHHEFPNNLPERPKHGDAYVDLYDNNIVWIYDKLKRKYLRTRVTRKNYIRLDEGYLSISIDVKWIIPIIEEWKQAVNAIKRLWKVRRYHDFKSFFRAVRTSHRRIQHKKLYKLRMQYERTQYKRRSFSLPRLEINLDKDKITKLFSQVAEIYSRIRF